MPLDQVCRNFIPFLELETLEFCKMSELKSDVSRHCFEYVRRDVNRSLNDVLNVIESHGN